MATLAWLGRQGTRAVAVSVFAGIALPPLASLFKPAFAPALAVLLCLAFLRVEPTALHAYLRRPALVIAAALWTMLAMPLVFGFAFLFPGVPALASADGKPLALALKSGNFGAPDFFEKALHSLQGSA